MMPLAGADPYCGRSNPSNNQRLATPEGRPRGPCDYKRVVLPLEKVGVLLGSSPPPGI